jgi:hypothetical protein
MRIESSKAPIWGLLFFIQIKGKSTSTLFHVAGCLLYDLNLSIPHAD